MCNKRTYAHTSFAYLETCFSQSELWNYSTSPPMLAHSKYILNILQLIMCTTLGVERKSEGERERERERSTTDKEKKSTCPLCIHQRVYFVIAQATEYTRTLPPYTIVTLVAG